MSLRLDKNVVLLLIGLLLGAALGLGGLAIWNELSRPPSEKELAARQSLKVGNSAPDFALQTLDGQIVRLAEQQGHPVVINFWATWCGPCKEEMPLLQQRYQQLSPDLIVLAVNFDESQEDVTQFADRLNLTLPLLLDPGGKIVDLYRVKGFPTSYFIDREGIIQAVYVGSLSEQQLDGNLKKIGALK